MPAGTVSKAGDGQRPIYEDDCSGPGCEVHTSVSTLCTIDRDRRLDSATREGIALHIVV